MGDSVALPTHGLLSPALRIPSASSRRGGRPLCCQKKGLRRQRTRASSRSPCLGSTSTLWPRARPSDASSACCGKCLVCRQQQTLAACEQRCLQPLIHLPLLLLLHPPMPLPRSAPHSRLHAATYRRRLTLGRPPLPLRRAASGALSSRVRRACWGPCHARQRRRSSARPRGSWQALRRPQSSRLPRPAPSRLWRRAAAPRCVLPPRSPLSLPLPRMVLLKAIWRLLPRSLWPAPCGLPLSSLRGALPSHPRPCLLLLARPPTEATSGAPFSGARLALLLRPLLRHGRLVLLLLPQLQQSWRLRLQRRPRPLWMHPRSPCQLQLSEWTALVLTTATHSGAVERSCCSTPPRPHSLAQPSVVQQW